MNRKILIGASLLLTVSLAYPPAFADGRAPDDPTQDKAMITAGFLSGHPDLRFRLLGLEKREQGKQEDAFKFFQRASYYADKPSQAMVAEMLWNGTGVEANKAQAYAWMDLAAERGYEGFLELRERYWSGLDATERDQAVQYGQDIYARFGDAASQPRIATALRRERKNVTGSRTGFSGNLKIFIPTPGGGEFIDASKFYDERYWDPAKYQQWHDSIWMKPRVATVSVGDATKVLPQHQETRIPTVPPMQNAPEPVTEDAMPEISSEGKDTQK
ncbi:sel1 repeat family protein [Stenotrophomonas humi]|uniref:sel1 repeat family protein n=1 Tax=Stenotrophomonas humi TaxID=405444 RepID=UPI000A93D933|nr:sel1 repeat family protein [Stenotrophomonas humi]